MAEFRPYSCTCVAKWKLYDSMETGWERRNIFVSYKQYTASFMLHDHTKSRTPSCNASVATTDTSTAKIKFHAGAMMFYILHAEENTLKLAKLN
jgi:hypothetical protein